jgi:membrane-bound lytic murein transglycosylase C
MNRKAILKISPKTMQMSSRPILFTTAKYQKKASLYYKKYLSKKWGEKNVKLSSAKTFVQYGEDLESRESIDFQNGKVTIEIVSDKDSIVNPEYFEKKIDTLSSQSISDAIKKDPVAQLELKFIEKKSEIISDALNKDEKYMQGYIKLQKIKKEDIKQKKVVLNNKTKYINYVDVDMVPDYLQKRAAFIKPYVLKKAKEYSLKPSAIFATIETESSFNPLAKSDVPAYGLMQIVPSTAGVDAYYALTNEKKLLTPKYLYDPHKNINIGTKYMQIIRERYLRNIKDPISKFYCASTAYNAGIGSLTYSFTGNKRETFKAMGIINKMSSDEVYEHLRNSQRLTHEAKNYVKLIRERSKNYKAWDEEV